MTCGGWYHHTIVRGKDGIWRSSSLREELAYVSAGAAGVAMHVQATAGLPGTGTANAGCDRQFPRLPASVKPNARHRMRHSLDIL